MVAKEHCHKKVSEKDSLFHNVAAGKMEHKMAEVELQMMMAG